MSCRSTMFLVIGLAISTQGANAQGVTVKGGGHEVGLYMQRALYGAIETIKDDPEFQAVIDIAELDRFSREVVELFAVDEHLFETVDGGVLQEVTAVNIKDGLREIVKANIPRFLAIPYKRVAEALMLHEVLSLKKIERSGRYPYSGKYLAKYGFTGDDLQRDWDGTDSLVTCDDSDDRHFSVIQDPEDMFHVNIVSPKSPIRDGRALGLNVQQLAMLAGVPRAENVVRMTMTTYDCHDHNRQDRLLITCGGGSWGYYSEPSRRNDITFFYADGRSAESLTNFTIETARVKITGARSSEEFLRVDIGIPRSQHDPKIFIGIQTCHSQERNK